MNNFYLAASGGLERPKISIFINFFYWLMFFVLSMINHIPPAFIRYFMPGRQIEGEWAILGSFINGATVILIMALPWRLFVGGISGGVGFYLISRLVKIMAAFVIIYGGYGILSRPEENEAENFAPPIDNATKCMLRLTDFIDYAKRNIGSQTNVEMLWQMVYTYLKNDELITDAINKGVPPDSIVMNAIGAVAYRLIESGRFHKAKGVLSAEGEYIAEVWKMAAAELVNRSYNTRDDMQRGLASLGEAIERTGGS
jgi:hypothetical protein